MSFETPTPPSRLGNIQALRGFAAVFVMISHLLIIETKYSLDPILPHATELLMIGVDLFFAISGFIMVYVVMGRGTGTREMGRFLFSRISRIYPLYWLVSLVVLAVYIIRPEIVFSSTTAPPNLIKSFALWPDTRPPLLTVGWTLIHEMYFYFIFSLTLLCSRKFLLPFLILWAIFITGGQYFQLEQYSPELKVLFSPLTYTFLLGALAGLAYTQSRSKLDIWILVGSLLLWSATLILLSQRGSGMIESHWGRFIHFGLPSAMLVYGMATVSKTMPRWTKTLGDWSYSLYLTHVLTLSLLGRLWAKFANTSPFSDSPLDNIIALILLSLSSIIVAGLTYKLLEKPMLNAATKTRKHLFGS